MSTFDVIVVGAGPTGLALACELALVGVRCRVLERRASQPNITRAFAVHARTLELLDARGLAEDLIAQGVAVRSVQGVPGVTLDLRELDSRYPMVLIAPQSATEKLLEARAEQLGVEIAHGCDVVALRQSGEAVELDVADDSAVPTSAVRTSAVRTSAVRTSAVRTSAVRTERASYVVGCDGAHSTVRELVGVDFVGVQYETHIMLADARLAEPPPQAIFGRTNSEGVVIVVPFGDGWYRVIVWDRRREDVPLDEPPSASELRDGLRRVAGTDFGMAPPRWSSRFLSERRQARHYRVGRVFLAGDAAHVHSPLGAQGMNTGIQDAMNLGWKLAAALRGWAPPWLLDSYEQERHPVGRSVLALTDAVNRLVLGRSRIGIVLRRLAIRTLLGLRRTRRILLGRLSGIGIGYPSRSRGAHRLTGQRAPDPATDNGRLYELLRDGRFVLVDATLTGAAAQVVGPWPDRVRAVRRTATDPPAAVPVRPVAMLVRPDGYVAWAADRWTGEHTADELRSALSDWCGRGSPPSG